MNPIAKPIPFLDDPDQVDWDRVCFRERLAIHGLQRPPPGDAPLGFQLLSVQLTTTNGTPTLGVTIHRNYRMEQAEVTTDILTTLDRSLQTVQQLWKQTERYPKQSAERWRQLHFVRERHQFVLQVVQGATGCGPPAERLFRLNRAKMSHLYTEGALAVLTRLMAQRDYQSPVHGTAVEISGRTYPFSIHGAGWLPLRPDAGQPSCLRLVKKLSRGGGSSQSFSHVTSDGRLVGQAVHAWPVRTEALHLAAEKPPLDWQLDLQLVSTFLDRRLELRALFERYIREHPDLRRLLADFLQAVLLWKPSDVFQFADDFFTPHAVTYKSKEQKDEEDAAFSALASVHGDWDELWTEPKTFTD